MPGIKSTDAAMHATRYLIVVLETPAPASPLQVGDDKIAALRKLVDIFDSTMGRNTKSATTPTEMSAPYPKVPRFKDPPHLRVDRTRAPTKQTSKEAPRSRVERFWTSTNVQRPRVDSSMEYYPLRNCMDISKEHYPLQNCMSQMVNMVIVKLH